jgi:hypothetical protein
MADTDGAVVVDGGKDLESGSLDCGGSGYDMGKGKLWAAFAVPFSSGGAGGRTGVRHLV